MPKKALGPDTQVTLNGTNISQFVTNINVNDEHDQVDITGMQQAYRQFTPGIGNMEITTTLLQGYGSGEPDSLIFPLYNNKIAGTIKVTDTSSTVVYTAISQPYNYAPFNGGPGDANSIDVTWANGSTAGLTRGTS